MSVATITPREAEAMRLRGSPVELIDVRTPVEYREVHAEPARLVSLDRLDPGRSWRLAPAPRTILST